MKNEINNLSGTNVKIYAFYIQNKFKCRLNSPVQINTTARYKYEPYYR